MLIWLWLEILALGMMILWTMDLARVLVARRFQNCSEVRIPHKRNFIDRLPMNGDITPLPFSSKAFITLVRWTITILVAVSALGIEPTTVFKQSQPSKQVVIANSANFSGRSVNPEDQNTFSDFAASICEEIDVMSLKKLKTFISESRFSCNTGKHVGNRDVIAEVIIDRDAIENISRGEKRPVNVKLGDLSKMNKEESNNTDVELGLSNGAPVFMFLTRRYVKNREYGECAGDREYLLISNRKEAKLLGHFVAVALVICNVRSTVYLRNTDQMLFLPDAGAMQRLNLARRVITSIVSIVSNEDEKVYFGNIKRTTVISNGYNHLILILAAINILLYLMMIVAKSRYKIGLHTDVFSPVAMFLLAISNCRYDDEMRSAGNSEIVMQGEKTEDGLEIQPLPSLSRS